MRRLLPFLLAAAGPAHAADDVLSLDTVLVVSLDAADPALRPDALRMRDALHAGLGERFVLGMSDVPPFRGYDADVYLQACPAGQYVDCAFVLGQRAGAERVVAGELRAVEGGFAVRLSFVDVPSASLRLQAELTVAGAEDPALATFVGQILDGLAAGILQPIDVRLDPDAAPREDEVDEAALRVAAEELARLERDEGAVERDPRRRARRDRLRLADVDADEGGEAVPPWEPLGMSRSQWVRWRNSGRTLADWRYRARGRQGEILVGASLAGLAWGPWAQVYEGWYARDEALDVADRYVMHDLAPGLLRTWELSLGVGVLPWLDVAAFGGPRVAPYRYRVQHMVARDEAPRLAEPEERVATTWHLGGRVTLAPLPAARLRPTLGAGVLAWWGTRRERVLEAPDALETLEASRMVLLGLHPGVELSVTRHLLLWLRGDVEIPLARSVDGPLLYGGQRLPGRPSPDTSDELPSLGGSVGLTARLRVRPKASGRSSSGR